MVAAKKTDKGPASDAVMARIQKLLALAADDGASEDERRTAGAIAARLIREHGVVLGRAAPPPTEIPSMPPMQSVHLDTVIGGVRTVVNVASQGLGFDVFGFAQGLLRERLQGAMQEAIRAPAPAKRRRRRVRAR